MPYFEFANEQYIDRPTYIVPVTYVRSQRGKLMHLSDDMSLDFYFAALLWSDCCQVQFDFR
jgi:hypothetical protein